MSRGSKVLPKFIHDLLVKGALEKGWGGPECRAAVPYQVHVYESALWLFLCKGLYKASGGGEWYRSLVKNINLSIDSYNQENPKKANSLTLGRLFEVAIGTLHLLMFLQIVYYKLNISSMINMLQPCHVILLLQGIALLSKGATGVLISILILPALTGTLLAMLFPETGGLDQFWEMEAYWLQHYLIQAMPLYLLLRRNSQALQFCNFKTTVAGLWILCVLHFSLFEFVDLSLNVNVEFMLCPTGAMIEIFKNFPPWMINPSYRTTLTLGVFLIGAIISYLYVGTATFITNLMGGGKRKDIKSKSL